MLTIAQVLTFLLIHLGVVLVVTAYYALAASILPNVTERAALRFGRRFWLPGVVGVLISAPWVSLVLMQAGGPVGGVGAVIGLAWLFCGLVGGAGIALHVGRAGERRHATHASIRGGLLITLSWILPLLGWFFVLPLTLATGVGCLILGLFPVKGAQASAQPEPATPGGGRPDAGLAFSDPDHRAF